MMQKKQKRSCMNFLKNVYKKMWKNSGNLWYFFIILLFLVNNPLFNKKKTHDITIYVKAEI